MHQLRHPSQTHGGLRARGAVRVSVPHLAVGHLTALRELHHAAHRPQHRLAHDEGEVRPLKVDFTFSRLK